MKRVFCWFMLFMLSSLSCLALEPDIRIDFSEGTDVVLMGPGFGSIPEAELTLGDIPADNAFEGATDGIGAIIDADPGEGLMIFGPVIETNKIALIRCVVRTNSTNANVGIATIDQGPDEYVATNIPNNSDGFLDQYKRISIFFIPPSSGLRPLVQIMNNGEQPITAYVDNFEIFLLEPDEYYNSRFLDGDNSDPDVISISPTEPPLDEQTPTPSP